MTARAPKVPANTTPLFCFKAKSTAMKKVLSPSSEKRISRNPETRPCWKPESTRPAGGCAGLVWPGMSQLGRQATHGATQHVGWCTETLHEAVFWLDAIRSVSNAYVQHKARCLSTLQDAEHGWSMQHGLMHLSPARGCSELAPRQTAPWPAQSLRRGQDVFPRGLPDLLEMLLRQGASKSS